MLSPAILVFPVKRRPKWRDLEEDVILESHSPFHPINEKAKGRCISCTLAACIPSCTIRRH
jgi:hypothetical protein